MWENGFINDLGTLGDAGSEAVAINMKGQVAGNSYTASGDTHAFVFDNGSIKDIGSKGFVSGIKIFPNVGGQ